jgi:hypothetical protein
MTDDPTAETILAMIEARTEATRGPEGALRGR